MNDRVADLEKGIKAERDKLDGHENNIESSVKAKILDYYGLKEGEKVTLRTLLGKPKSKLSARLAIKRMMTFVKQLKNFRL